jgi:hypothetical protein
LESACPNPADATAGVKLRANATGTQIRQRPLHLGVISIFLFTRMIAPSCEQLDANAIAA